MYAKRIKVKQLYYHHLTATRPAKSELTGNRFPSTKASCDNIRSDGSIHMYIVKGINMNTLFIPVNFVNFRLKETYFH